MLLFFTYNTLNHNVNTAYKTSMTQMAAHSSSSGSGGGGFSGGGGGRMEWVVDNLQNMITNENKIHSKLLECILLHRKILYIGSK